MSNQTLKKISHYWQARNPRERGMAILIALLIGGMGGYSLVLRAMDTLQRLDTEIARLQDDILLYHDLIARRQIVERQYSRVAAQHSSAWTAPEIQERLRQEIYRLARKTPPPLNEDGIPEVTSSADGNLVEIPALGQGSLSENTEEEFRQYSIGFRVPAAEFSAMLSFLERLQTSPQSLRIDGLDLVRHPESTQVTANVDLTRIIVAGSDVPASEDSQALRPLLDSRDWTLEGCVLAGAPGMPGDPVVLRATGATATAFAPRDLVPGTFYELEAELVCTGEGSLGVAAGDGTAYAGSVPFAEAGAAHRYVVRFRTAPDGGPTVRVPVLTFAGEGAVLQITRLELNQVPE